MPACSAKTSVEGRRGRTARQIRWISNRAWRRRQASAGHGTDLVSRLDWLDRGIWAPIAFGVTLIVAGLYEFTPLKRLCLRHCRAPSAFVAQHWQDGWAGALDMGMQHGLYCVGCCWALFAVLVVAGMMSITLMLLLALVIFAENVLPHGPRTSATVAVVLIALGLLVASGAVQLPWHA